MSNTTFELPQLEEDDNAYGYVPTRSVAAIFVALFAVTTIIHLVQGIRYRLWWTIPTLVIGGLGEVLGWSGRLWSSFSPGARDPFLMQITTTIIAPTFMSAANFTVLGFLIRKLGLQFSRLTPRLYIIIFVVLDVIALMVQSVGGAMASMADTLEGSNRGGRIMLIGIAIQTAAMTIYVVCAAEFLIRYYKNKPIRAPVPHAQSEDTLDAEKAHDPSALDGNVKLLVLGIVLTTVFLFIRAIYRLIELNDGWNGTIITTQLYFNLLDGMPILLVMFCWNFLHPGLLLRDEPAPYLKWKS